MSVAEGEQCALDDFWGLVANQVEQAESTAAMEREDRRSEHVRATLKREERYSLWEQEDLRKRGTRSIIREKLEDAARREYLEVRVLVRASTSTLTVDYVCDAHTAQPRHVSTESSLDVICRACTIRRTKTLTVMTMALWR